MCQTGKIIFGTSLDGVPAICSSSGDLESNRFLLPSVMWKGGWKEASNTGQGSEKPSAYAVKVFQNCKQKGVMGSIRTLQLQEFCCCVENGQHSSLWVSIMTFIESR